MKYLFILGLLVAAIRASAFIKIDPTVVLDQTSDELFFDFDTLTWSQTSSPETDLRLYFIFDNANTIETPTAATFGSTWNIVNNGIGATRFEFGESISVSGISGASALSGEFANFEFDDSEAGDVAFIAMINNTDINNYSQEAWIALDWDDPNNQLSVLAFDVNAAGTGIPSAIPEPSAFAALTGLIAFTLVVRRRESRGSVYQGLNKGGYCRK